MPDNETENPDPTCDPVFMAGTPWNPGNDLFDEYIGTAASGELYLVTVWLDGTCWLQTRPTRFSQWSSPVRCRRQ